MLVTGGISSTIFGTACALGDAWGFEITRRPYRKSMGRQTTVDSPMPFWALAYKRMKGYLAPSLTLLLMLLAAVTAYGMPCRAAVSAAIPGMESGLWPIGWIILTAVFFYNLTVEAGQSGIIQSSISCFL